MNISGSPWTASDFGPPVPQFSPYLLTERWAVADYPSASNRKLIHMRSQLNLAILVNLEDVARAILPYGTQQNRRLHWDQTTIRLDHEIDPSFPGGVVNPGYWARGSINPPVEIGTTLTSLYARIRKVPETVAEDALRTRLGLPWQETFMREEKLQGCIWEADALIEPLQNPLYWFPRYSVRPYLGSTGLPILWAVQERNFPGVTIRYFALIRRKSDPAAYWVEALPPGELPLFGTVVSTPGKMPVIRIVPSEFDPRFQERGSVETFCAVPGGAASLPRTDLRALAGCRVHLELLPHELAYTPHIVDAMERSRGTSITISIVGNTGTFPLEQLPEMADLHGHSFPLTALKDAILPDNALITAGSPLPPSSNPRRMLLAPIIPEGGLVWLYAREKIGKTWLALTIAQTVSQGGSLGPWQASEPASVLYIDGEMHPGDLQTAIAKVTRGQGNHATVSFDALCAKKTKRGVINLMDPEWQKEIELRAQGVRLVIFDNFYSLTNNNVGEFPEVLDFLQRLQAQGIAVLVIDHTNREGGLQGAHTKERAAETVIEMRIPEGRSWRENIRAVEVTKARHYIPEPADYFLGEMVFTEESFHFDVETAEIPAGPEPIPAEIVKLAPIMIARDVDKLSFPKIRELLGIPRTTAWDWYKKAKNLTGADQEALDLEVQRLIDARKAAE